MQSWPCGGIDAERHFELLDDALGTMEGVVGTAPAGLARLIFFLLPADLHERVRIGIDDVHVR